MNKIPKILILALLCTAFATSNAQKIVRKYISKYESIAIEKMKEYKIPASIILGVGIVESGAGSSDICKVFNNHFGIVGKNKDSRKRLGYNSVYREYESDSACFDHFCRVLAKKKFYGKLKGDDDYKEWLKQMNLANYASAKQAWVDKISATINKFKLYEYDEL